MGNKLRNPSTSQKSFGKIINRVMNKCRTPPPPPPPPPPKIPPLLINNQFILDCREKAKDFNEFFSQQCKPIANSSVLPNVTFLANKRIDQITINIKAIKATGSYGISGQMLLLCDVSVSLPLKIIFRIILLTSTYPDKWKLPIFKKGDKQLIKSYRPISLLPICGNIFEKIIFNKEWIFFFLFIFCVKLLNLSY